MEAMAQGKPRASVALHGMSPVVRPAQRAGVHLMRKKQHTLLLLLLLRRLLCCALWCVQQRARTPRDMRWSARTHWGTRRAPRTAGPRTAPRR